MKTGIELIKEERGRQLMPKSSGGEGWTSEHDDSHVTDELTQAAICYAVQSSKFDLGASEVPWPWEPRHWKPCKDRVRNLVKAGALIAAEIDRLQRLNAK